jgi:hypothetical protein
MTGFFHLIPIPLMSRQLGIRKEDIKVMQDGIAMEQTVLRV